MPNYYDFIEAVVDDLLEAIQSERNPLAPEERTKWAGNRKIVSKDSEDKAREEARSELGTSFDPSHTFWMAIPSMSGKSDISRLKGHPDQRNTGAHLAHTRAEGPAHYSGIGAHGVRLYISPTQAKEQIGQGRVVPIHLGIGSDLHLGHVVKDPEESYARANRLSQSYAKLGNPELAREHGLAGQRLALPYSGFITPKHIEDGTLALDSEQLAAASEHLTAAHKDWMNRADVITRQRALGAAGKLFARHLGNLGIHGTVHAEPYGETLHVGRNFDRAKMQRTFAPVHTVSLQNRVHIAGESIPKESEIY